MKVAKAIVAFVGAIVSTAMVVFVDNPAVMKYLMPIVGILTVLGVYQVPNRPA